MANRLSFAWKTFLCGSLLLLLLPSALISQETPLDTSSELKQARLINHPIDSMPPIYGVSPGQNKTGAVTTLSTADFNQGLISDPLLLIQGKVAGLQVYNRGGDPNVESLLRIRGLSAYDNRSPLIVIDGVPGASLENLDPNDIASITLLRDGSNQAIYGIRASNGVLLITTRSGLSNTDTLIINYQGQFAVASAYPGVPVTSANEFRQRGGLDLGSSVDWLNEIIRDGLSTTHGLALQGRQGKTLYRISGNYRNVDGILQKSGFEQLNFRTNVSRTFLKDNLSVQVSAAYTDRNSQLGFNEAFRYATLFNPTIPLDAADAPFPYNTELFGGYFETSGLFDSFNPKAIVEQNERNAKLQALTTAALLSYRINEGLSLNFRYAYQNQFSNERAYYSPQSLFRGNAYDPLEENRGRADLTDIEGTFSLYELFGNYKKGFGKTQLDLTLGTAYQDGSYLENHLDLNGYTNEELALDTRRIDDVQNWENEATQTDTINNGWSDKLSAFFGRAQFNFNDKLMLSTSIRYEGSSKLGEDNRWGIFPGMGLALNLHEMWHPPGVDQLRFRASYGVTGMLPEQGGLSQYQIRLRQVDSVTIIPDTMLYANPDLGMERKREINLGLDFQFGRLSGYVDWYSRRVSDWIDYDVTTFLRRFANQNTLTSNGIDLGLNITLLNRSNASYATGILFSTYQTRYTDLGGNSRFAIGPGGILSNPTMPIQEGKELGVFAGPVFVRADDEGIAVFQDLNQDGQVVIGVDAAFDDNGDFDILGHGLPDFEWGWSHQLRFRGWQLNALFRGAFGHSLVHMNRAGLESDLFFTNQRLYNQVNTELAVDGLRASPFSSLYVEQADFLKLDILSLSKAFPLGQSGSGKQLSVSVTGQNLLTLTNYTGPDPEPALEDGGATTFGSIPNRGNDATPLAPGIDRRNSYLPARTVVLGVRLIL